MNFRTLDLNLLRVFDVVMFERNVTRAAARLAMTQPAVSNALRRLHQATGEDLFVSGPTGMTPTPQAEALWPTVRAALSGLSHALDPQAFDPRQDAQGFRLLMADAAAAVLMPALIRGIEQQALQVTLRVLPLGTRDPRPQLEQGQTDVALGFFPELAAALQAEGDSAVVCLDPLYHCGYVCVMRRGHELARHPVLTLDDYCAAGHVRVSFAGRQHGFVDAALQGLKRQRRVVLTVNEFATAARVVQQSDLLTVLPRSFVSASGLAPDLVMRPFPGALPRIEVGLLWHRRDQQQPAQRWLRQAIHEAAQSLFGGELAVA
ncbi:LysR family transcriptional regulator [Aquabacterium sp.]|uniref:LysR family transcriptional regulator n=1 Tax=Aquabacterium sp. TaxID=1872578 RepID=UPI002C251A73|nr:LysR family transcriptional regulator [Aquabacterium sp.]HSW08367.1 LysR family transcriptional regulator [Aquabacterium sp.]